MASSNIDDGPEQDWPDICIAEQDKVSKKGNTKNVFSRIAKFFAIFGKRKQKQDNCGTERTRQLRVSTPNATPPARSGRPDIGGQEEQKSADGLPVYETDIWHESNRSRRVSLTEEVIVPCYEILTGQVSRECPRYKAPEERVSSMILPPSSVARPNYQDFLRRVSVVVYKHIKICEQQAPAVAQFDPDKAEMFNEKHFRTPTFRYNFIQPPVMALPGHVFTLKEVPSIPKTPDVDEIFDFVTNIFVNACLSSECSVICLIYVERLMTLARVPLLASTWKPIVLGSLLLATKMWQDLSSWNGEFASVCPEYVVVGKINKLEVKLLCALDWDLFVSSSIYAKYYFALRSMSWEKSFRRCYDRIVQRDSAQDDNTPDTADTADAMLSRSI